MLLNGEDLPFSSSFLKLVIGATGSYSDKIMLVNVNTDSMNFGTLISYQPPPLTCEVENVNNVTPTSGLGM